MEKSEREVAVDLLKRVQAYWLGTSTEESAAILADITTFLIADDPRAIPDQDQESPVSPVPDATQSTDAAVPQDEPMVQRGVVDGAE
jgi:hypothetical protein